MRTGGDAGNIAPRGDGSIPSSGNLNPRSQGLVLAVAGTGRLTSDGALQLGGGGDLNVRIGGEVNPSREARATQTYSSSGFDGLYSGGTIHDLQGALINLRGSASLYSGALGGIDPRYDTLLRDPAEVRSRDAFSPTLASSTGGLTLVAGDTGMRLETRGDLVLGGVTDPGRVGVPNTVGFTAPDGSVYQGGGIAWFSLWTAHTSIDLFAAGGNLTPSTQLVEATNAIPMAGRNLSPSDGRFIYPSIVRAAAPEGSIYLGPSSGYMGGVSLNVSTTPYSLLLAPSLNGELELLAGDSIYAGGYSVQRSGADPANLPSIWTPAFAGYSDAALLNPIAGNGSPDGNPAVIGGLPLFYFGPDSAASLARDLQPARFYALTGDIVGLNSGAQIRFGEQAGNRAGQTWYEGAGPVWMRAGRDIVAPEPHWDSVSALPVRSVRMPRSPATSSSTTTPTTSRWSRPAATSSTATSTSPAPVPWRSAPGATFSWRIARRSPVSARWCRATAGRVPISCSRPARRGPTIRPSSSATWIRPTWRRAAPRWPSSRARWSGPTKASWPSG